jgi:hypothetical protein
VSRSLATLTSAVIPVSLKLPTHFISLQDSSKEAELAASHGIKFGKPGDLPASHFGFRLLIPQTIDEERDGGATLSVNGICAPCQRCAGITTIE